MSKKRILVLGSTGSIGKQALEVIDFHSDRLELAGLAAYSSSELLAQQAQIFNLPDSALALTKRDGMDALIRLIDTTQADIVLNALVGAAGLRTTMYTLESGLTLALANKESLIVGGNLVIERATAGQILPVDSEHSAIFQCLQAGQPGQEEKAEESDQTSKSAVKKLWLTASGGPFRGKSRNELREMRATDALAHPTWNMGPKITIDSATLMNKGLEVIEAHYLFGVDYDDISVLVQPKSLIHSMVEFVDGSTLGHLGIADMRVPIQYALSYPERWPSVEDLSIDYREQTALELGRPDYDTFGCLRLAFEAGRAGGTAPCILNAANEIAVAAFLEGKIGFLDIERTVSGALTSLSDAITARESIEQLEEIDARARQVAYQLVRQRSQ